MAISSAISPLFHTHTQITSTAPEEENLDRNTFPRLAEAVKVKNENHLPVVPMAHLAVGGCDTNRHDLIGGMDYAEVTEMGTGYDYLAFGHIQKSILKPVLRYCGTPIPVNFGEHIDHSVSIVELEKDATHQW